MVTSQGVKVRQLDSPPIVEKLELESI
jgi:hypothetical protein